MDANPTQPDALIRRLSRAAAKAMPMREAITLALVEAMRDDPSVMVLGEAVGRLGGVSGATAGLLDAFGEDRVVDLPISQGGAIGLAVGLALGGKRPVVELTGALSGGFGQVARELASVASRSGGEFSAPVVIRLPYGKLGDDDALAGLIAATPGLTVVCPSCPADAHALLGQALRAAGPTLILESREAFGSEGPLSDTPARAGQAILRREGTHATILAMGHGVSAAMEAAERAAERGHSVEVLDLRSLHPLDVDAVAASVKRTGRVVVVDELSAGGANSPAGERLLLAATDAAFLYLESPPRACPPDPARIDAAITASVHF